MGYTGLSMLEQGGVAMKIKGQEGHSGKTSITVRVNTPNY